jgi:hypothetical protein
MNIDWEKLTEGFREELEKNGSAPSGRIPKIWPAFKKYGPAVGVTGAGAAGLHSIYGGAQNTLDGLADTLKMVAPIGLAALMGMAGNNANNQGGMQPTYLPSHQKPSYLTPDPGTVSSISRPRAYASPIKQADIMDMFGDAINRRIANSVLNQVTKTNALGYSTDNPVQAPAAPHAENRSKELELVAKYPELENLLKDEANKAYLKKLLET